MPGKTIFCRLEGRKRDEQATNMDKKTRKEQEDYICEYFLTHATTRNTSSHPPTTSRILVENVAVYKDEVDGW